MIKAKPLQKGDLIAIVSLSSGMLGEFFCNHQLELGIKRIKELGYNVVFMKNALKGIEYIKDNPKARADDLKQAFYDDNVKAIITAIGGIDTYKTIPYLLDDLNFVNKVKTSPKLFMGYSDTTNNHFMFYKLGLVTYYGPTFIVDFAELDSKMLSYTKDTIKQVFANPDNYKIESSDIWYEERTDFSAKAVNTSRISHKETRGYEVLRGSGKITGTFFGGCLESIYNMLEGTRFDDEVKIIKDYQIFPKTNDFKEMLFFIETSEEQITPNEFETMILRLKQTGLFKHIKALLVGKPQNERYYDEYKATLTRLTLDEQTKIMYNVNFGHAHPKTIIGYGLKGTIDFDHKIITVIEPYFAK